MGVAMVAVVLSLLVFLTPVTAQTSAPTSSPTSAPTSASSSAPTSTPTSAPGATPALATPAPTTPALATAAPAATPTATPTAAPTATVAKVVLELTVEGVDFSLLSADATMLASFKSECAKSIATNAGVNETDVDITLTAASVNVRAEVSPAAGTTAAQLKETLTADSTIGSSLVTALGNVAGLSTITTGDLAVSGVVTSTVTATTGNTTTTEAGTASASHAARAAFVGTANVVGLVAALQVALRA